jgi:isoleucyl-tRNA synthetase
VRRSRDRFWQGADSDGRGAEAFDTLYTVLETVTRVAAPLLPLISEEIWRGLTGGRSVHLTDWPTADEFPVDEALVHAMDAVRGISSTALSLRKQAGLRVRLPLARLTVVVADADELAPFEAILRDELNVKEVTLVPLVETSASDYGVTSRLAVNARAAGPRLGRGVQTVIKAAKAGDWSEVDGVVTAGGVELAEGEYELTLEVGGAGADDRAIALLPRGGFVLLDTATTPELEAEGLARDLIRAVQDARKGAGLDVSDRIVLDVMLDEVSLGALEPHATWIAEETLATGFAFTPLTIALEGGEGAVAFGPAGTAIIRVEKVEAADV